MKVILLTVCLFLVGCLAYVGMGAYSGRGGGEPFVEEYPVFPLGKVLSDKTVTVTNPLGQPVTVVMECRQEIFNYILPARKVKSFKTTVMTEDVYKHECHVVAWNITVGY